MSKKMHIKLNVNGKDEEFLAEPRELLIYTLRERLNITGPHIGCETSPCGACTVTINGKSVKACTMFAVQANAFLHHQVRNMVGSLLAVGAGERPEQGIAEVLEARDRTLAGPTGPAQGLVFVGPLYPRSWPLPAEVTGNV